MPNGTDQSGITKWLLGIITAIVLSISGFTLVWLVEANAELRVLKKSVIDLAADKELDKTQNETLTKHWKLHSWSRDEINDLRHKSGLDRSRWPDL